MGSVPHSTRATTATGPSGGNGQSAGPIAVGNLTTAAGSGLPLPRSELILAGKSLVRCMRRVTHGAENGKAGDPDQLMGDAARIEALASILAPTSDMAALATAGAASGADAVEPEAVVERLRLNFGQLGYMQGVLDENVCQLDGQLGGLDGVEAGPEAETPEVPTDPAGLSEDALRAARTELAARADVCFDALIRAQEQMNDLDNRRRNLDHQVDAVSDLLARLDEAGTTPVPRHVGDTLCYGLGWHLAGDAVRMATALRDSQAQARATARPPATPAPSSSAPASSSAQGPAAAAPAPARPKGTPFAEWTAANKIEGGRMAILEALAGLQRWCGFYDALTGTLQRELVALRLQADAASATCRALSAELQRRALAAGEKQPAAAKR
jgi:hypothetical protein